MRHMGRIRLALQACWSDLLARVSVLSAGQQCWQPRRLRYLSSKCTQIGTSEVVVLCVEEG